MKRSTIELVFVVLFGCAPLAIWAAATQEQAASEMGQVEITVMLPQGSNIEFHPEAASYQAITEATEASWSTCSPYRAVTTMRSSTP